MKKICFIISIFAIALAGCRKSDDLNEIEGTVITELRSYTEKSPNPMNVTNYRLAKSKETLESLTHVSKNRLFYMDYLVDFPMEELCKTGSARYTSDAALEGEKMYFTDYLDLLYYEHPDPIPLDDPLVCSAFVCQNEKKETLFCHNMDGAGGSIIALYQRPKPGRYGFVSLSSTIYNGIRVAPEYLIDGCLMDGETDLSYLLTQHIADLGGMNDQGLCYCMLQLPPLQKPDDYDSTSTLPHITVENKNGDYSLPQLTYPSMYYMLLTRCATVDDAEDMLRNDFDFTHLNYIMNGHLLIADATGDYAVFEYWNDTLYVLRADERRVILEHTSHVIPFEYCSMENYYCNLEATKTYMQDEWQYEFSAKARVGRMMNSYRPVMSEFQALKCLQEGTYAIEYPGMLTNYSAVYNANQRTVLFNVHNDMSEAFTIDLKKDLQ